MQRGSHCGRNCQGNRGAGHTHDRADLGFVRRLLSQRKNLVITCATGSGETTFANACLREVARTAPTTRVVLIEDTPELQSELAVAAVHPDHEYEPCLVVSIAAE